MGGATAARRGMSSMMMRNHPPMIRTLLFTRTLAARRRWRPTDQELKMISSGIARNQLEKQTLLKNLSRQNSGRRPFQMSKMMMIKSISSLSPRNLAKKEEGTQLSAIYLSI